MRYFIGLLIAIGLIVLVFVLIFKNVGGKTSVPKPLVDYAYTDTVMRFTTEGPVTADQDYQSMQISVSQSDTQFIVYQGYQGTISFQEDFASNPIAYANFLRALDINGYTKGNTGPSVQTDERGYCALGERYIYEVVNDNGQDAQRFWSTSCGGEGTYKGSVANVIALFENQIPNFAQVEGKLNFNLSSSGL